MVKLLKLVAGIAVVFSIVATVATPSQAQTGTVRLTFDDAMQSGVGLDKALGNTKPEQDFSIPAKESRSFSWRITVPDGCGFLIYKTVGASATVSDGEEGAIPVLSRRLLA